MNIPLLWAATTDFERGDINFQIDDSAKLTDVRIFERVHK